MSEIAVAEGVVPACTLAVLWALEGVAPALHGARAGLAQRARHLMLGLVNASVGLVVAAMMLASHRASEQIGFGTLRWLPLHDWARAAMALILLDLWGYACHVLMHRVPVLWRVHAVHHHADRLEATVAMRFHAAEIMLQGAATVVMMSVVGLGIEHVALYNLVLLPVSLFHHSDVRVPARLDRAMRLFIVTPSLHWLHHSRWQPETDSNYSPVLSVWDRLFGTLRTRSRPEAVEVGLDGFSPDEVSTVRGMLATPFSGSRSGMGRPPCGSGSAAGSRSGVTRSDPEALYRQRRSES
ncbi:MAG: sterol desaturase family protein [Phycisphaerales bacterium JB040]